MFRRRTLFPISAIAVLVAGGIAGWQVLERRKAEGRLSVLHIQLVEAERQAASLMANGTALTPEEAEALRADLAAAAQRLSVAETAVKETEDRLAEEISRRTSLETKNQSLADELSAAQKALEAAEAKAERALGELAKIEAVLPASRLAPADLAERPGKAAGGKEPETTASIGKSEDGATADGAPAANAVGPPADSVAKPPVVKRKRKSKPKEEYFLDSLF